MKQIILLLVIVTLIFLVGCNNKCKSGVYTNDGKCCTYVCDLDCENGYEEGTCNCKCKEISSGVANSGEGENREEDVNIDDIFDDSNDIEPPSIPI